MRARVNLECFGLVSFEFVGAPTHAHGANTHAHCIFFFPRFQSGSFEDTGTLLGISMRKVKSLTNAGGTKLMCYIVAFAVAVFFVIYFLMK